MLELPRTRLLGPVYGLLEATGAQYVPFGQFDVPQRNALTRLDASPRLTVPFELGPVGLEAWAGARGDLSLVEPTTSGAGAQSVARGRLLAGAVASTSLARNYSQFRHVLTPSVEVRAGSALPQDPLITPDPLRLVPIDELSLRTPAFSQAVASLSSRLVNRQGSEALRLEVAQGFDLRAGEISDTLGRVDFHVANLAASAIAQLDASQRIDLLSANARLSDARGDSVGGGYLRQRRVGTARMRSGIDELFGPQAPSGSDPTIDEQVDASLAVKPFQSLLVNYGVVVRLRNAPTGVIYHLLGATLGAPCSCWKLTVRALIRPKELLASQAAVTFNI